MMNHPGNAPEYDMIHLTPLSGSPLEGKRVLFLGSSVTEGSAAEFQGIPEYFGRRLGCLYTKEAVGGTTLVDTGSDSYVQRLLRQATPQAHFDLLICQLSTNDAARGLPLGEISPGKELRRFDTGTVTGAMEFIIFCAKATWGCDVAFYTGSRFESAAYAAMVARLKELQQKWDIRVLDLWSGEDFNSISPENRALYMNDGVHPTKAGYRQWWCPELERQLIAPRA